MNSRLSLLRYGAFILVSIAFVSPSFAIVPVDAAIVPGCAIPPTTFSGVGGTNSSGGAFTAMNAFKAAIGGVNNGGAPPPQTGGFRAINWDGVLLDGTDFGGMTTPIVMNAVTGIPTTRFQARGVVFDRVHAVANDGFVSVNAGVAGQFPAFSPSNTFAPFNNNTVTVNFVLASTPPAAATPALTRGFGAIFLDVEDPNTTSIEYFNGTQSLGKFFAPTGASGSPSFLGMLFNAPVVTSVQITLGTAELFDFDGVTVTPGAADTPPGGTDQVALDDFVYAEPTLVVAAVSGTEGAVITPVVATFDDLGVDTASAFTAMINWGDGTPPTSGTITSGTPHCFQVTGTHTYAEEGTFPISVVISDVGGSTLTMAALATIADAPLTASALTFSGTATFPTTATVATFTDANPFGVASDFTVTINWGDSTTTSGTVTGAATFSVNGTHTYAAIGSYPVTVTIHDAGGASAVANSTANITTAPTLSIGNASGTEGSNAVFTVTLSASSSQTVTVAFATASGTATSGADFTPTSGTLTFAPGVTTQTISVPLLVDGVVEPSETFTVTLSAPSNATIANATGTGTITDAAQIPALSLAVLMLLFIVLSGVGLVVIRR